MTTDPDSLDPPEIDETVYLYNIDELREYVIRTVDNYYDLPKKDNGQLSIIDPSRDSDGKIDPI